MAKRSDFAQKLLDDLRLRKERLAASQNSKGTNPTIGDAYAYSKKTYKSSRETKTTGTRAGSTQSRPKGASKSANTVHVSNQIVPFGRSQKSEQIGDLSMALAFALENGGKIRRTDSSGNSSMFSFLHNIGRRKMDCGKTGKSNSVISRHQSSSSQLPALSPLHIEEISRGAQKLNQILGACSNGINFDRYSIEIGRELLKGAMDLQESLRMLVNLQEASDYLITPQRTSRITLLEEDEDDDENIVNIDDQMQLDRPRFSFDRPSRNYNDIQELARSDLKLRLAALTYTSDITSSRHQKKVLPASTSHSHKRSVSYGPETKTLSTFSEQNHSSPLQSKQEKSRIPNVIAKLMGLDEIPGNMDSKVTMQKESGKQKVEAKITKKPAEERNKKTEARTKDTANLVLPSVKQKAILANKVPLIQDTVTSQEGKALTTRNGSTMVTVHDELPAQKDLEDIKPVTSSRKPTIKIDKQQSDNFQLNHYSGSRKEVQESERKQDSIKYREQRGAERSESREPVIKDEMQQMMPYMQKRSEAVHKLQEKPGYSGSMVHRENRYGNNLLGNQQKLQTNHGFQQVNVLQKSELQEKRHQIEESEQQSTKQKLQGRKQKGNEPISSNFSKPVSGATNLQKKQPQINQAASSRKSYTEHIDATQFNGIPDGRHSENPARDRSSTNLHFKIKDSINRNSSQHYSRGELESESAKAHIMSAVDEKAAQVQKTMKAKTAKGHKLEIPQKINEVMTKKSGNAYNLARPMKHPSSILQESKQTRQEKLATSREVDQMKESRFEVEEQIRGYNKSVENLQPSSVAQEQQKAAQGNSVLCSPLEAECQSLEEWEVFSPKDSSRNKVPKISKEQQAQEPDFGRAEECDLKNSASDPLDGTHEESREISHTPQTKNRITYTSDMTEPLTESENHLKQILMKSQVFMNTAEALFKLNIPISILHANGHDYHDQESKLVLDCGYEVMKRKGRRQELGVFQFFNVSITSTRSKSLDDLVKQTCKDYNKLKLYGRDGREDSPFEDYLPKMLEADVYSKEPDLNCMWDLGWNSMMFAFLEKDDVIKDVEKYVLNGLLDEITRDLFTGISASA